ncbi:MAG: hypothetical protein Tsb0014_27580 [Pleurocapsa sp.]
MNYFVELRSPIFKGKLTFGNQGYTGSAIYTQGNNNTNSVITNSIFWQNQNYTSNYPVHDNGSITSLYSSK